MKMIVQISLGMSLFKEAAKILGISANRVYAYVEEGRLPSAKAAHVIMLPLEAVEDFKPLLSGRPRNSVPAWRISPEENTARATSILVRIQAHEYDKLMTRFEEIYNQWLDEFKQALSDVLDWETAQYDTGRVIMHT